MTEPATLSGGPAHVGGLAHPRSRWLLVAIVALAFGLRVFRLDGHGYRGDEAFVIWFVRQDWVALIGAVAGNEPHPPLFYLLAKLWSGLVGDGEVVFRFLPLCFGVLAVPIVGKIGVRLGGRAEIGLIAALLLAANPFHLWHSQDLRMYTQTVALSLWSVLAFLRLDERPADRVRLLQYGVISALALLSHYTFLPLLVVQNLVWGMRHRQDRAALGRWILVQAVLGGMVLGWMAANWTVLLGYRGNGDQPALLDALRRAAVAYLTGRSGSPEWATLAGLLGGLVAAAGAIWIARRSRSLGALAVLGVVLGFAMQWAASLRGPVFDENYLLSASGLYYVLLGAGILALGRWLFPVVGVTILGVLLVASSLALGNYWLNPAYAKAADWRSEARAIERAARPGDVVILNYPDPTFEYYYRGAVPVRLIPATVPFDRAAVAAELRQTVAESLRIWLVPVHAANWDAEGFVEDWLENHALQVASAAWHQVRLVLYETPEGILADARPIDAELGPIRLRGVEIVAPDGCAAPCPVEVRLVWSAAERVSQEYKVFIHALDERGALVAQSDGVPSNWRRPTNSWAPGELIIDSHDLTVPAGRIQFIAGLYRDPGGRLTTPDGSDSLPLGDVTVR
ncbi:MAG: glycosyltransferase family 39 protein [Dehalococcoidia bacterium]